MVNMDQVLNQLHKHFKFVLLNDVTVDEQNRVNVKAHSMILEADKDHGQIPIALGKIEGDFKCHFCGLTTLKNAPHTITGSFSCHHNQLTSLAHGPQTVEGDYVCSYNYLKSFEHASEAVKGMFLAVEQKGLKSIKGYSPYARRIDITWSPDLPLLSLLQFKGVYGIRDPESVNFRGEEKIDLMEILEKWQPMGKTGALNCALEMKKAGYGGNARW